jgi:hypothetical protein
MDFNPSQAISAPSIGQNILILILSPNPRSGLAVSLLHRAMRAYALTGGLGGADGRRFRLGWF